MARKRGTLGCNIDAEKLQSQEPQEVPKYRKIQSLFVLRRRGMEVVTTTVRLAFQML